MKIAVITGVFPKLSEAFILNQITGLIDRGHDVSIFAEENWNESVSHPDVDKYKLTERTRYLNPPDTLCARLKAVPDVLYKNLLRHPCIILRSLNFIKYRRKALSLIMLHRVAPFLNGDGYDILHCHFGPRGNWGATLCELGLQAKLVTTYYGSDIRLGLKRGGQYYQKLFSRGDCFISIADYARKNLIKFGLDENNIVHLPVGIDLNKFPFKWHEDRFNDNMPVRILTVAKKKKKKGLDFGIRAIHKLKMKHPGLKFSYSIVGDGPLKGHVANLTRELKLEKIVHLLGALNQENVLELYANSHIFLLPSIAEVLPVCLMEAQASGLPVVATKVGSVNEVVIDGESGFLVDAGRASALTEKIEHLIRNPHMWPKMGLNGRRHVAEHYDINKLNNKLVQIYSALIDRRQI